MKKDAPPSYSFRTGLVSKCNRPSEEIQCICIYTDTDNTSSCMFLLLTIQLPDCLVICHSFTLVPLQGLRACPIPTCTTIRVFTTSFRLYSVKFTLSTSADSFPVCSVTWRLTETCIDTLCQYLQIQHPIHGYKNVRMSFSIFSVDCDTYFKTVDDRLPSIKFIFSQS